MGQSPSNETYTGNNCSRELQECRKNNIETGKRNVDYLNSNIKLRNDLSKCRSGNLIGGNIQNNDDIYKEKYMKYKKKYLELKKNENN